MEAHMTDITYRALASAKPVTAAKRVRTIKARVGKPKSDTLLRRIYEGMIEARRLEAEQMVKHHLYGGF
jgi:hypothetical protein